jgi:hypothetical protein
MSGRGSCGGCTVQKNISPQQARGCGLRGANPEPGGSHFVRRRIFQLRASRNRYRHTGEWRREQPQFPQRAGERRDPVHHGHGVPDPAHLLQHRRHHEVGT